MCSKAMECRLQLLICVACLSLVNSAKVNFYDSYNFTGLFHEINSSPSGCQPLPSYGYGKTVSLITDTCIILHENDDCQSYNSIRLDKGNHDNLTDQGFGNSFTAFHLCNASEGGEELNVDLYYTSDLKDLAVLYQDVCGCIDMPNYVGTRQVMSVDNHGNCVKLFEQNGCTGKQIELVGGSNSQTRNLALHFGVPTRSISSCDDHQACLQLEAKVFKFELVSNATRAEVLSTALDFELAAKTTFRNNGSATVTQEYHASKKIVESTEISRSRSLTEMTRVETEKETEWIAEVGVSFGPFSASTSLRKTFTEAHTMERNSSYQESEKYFNLYEREFSVSQTIQIAPCSLYEVSSVIKFRENFPVEYVTYAKVKGKYAGLTLNTAGIRERLTSQEYVEDYDAETVIAKFSGSMIADFGVETIIDGSGIPIAGCKTS